MGESIGAKTIDLEWVQVHPTGLVKPDDADAKVKFLAAEALRGVGGLVLDKNGKRFANELGRRDYVTGEMWKNSPRTWAFRCRCLLTQFRRTTRQRRSKRRILRVARSLLIHLERLGMRPVARPA